MLGDKKSFQKSRGFTLIELMIVIAIISILSSLASSKFRLFQAKAKFSEGKINLSTLETLVDIYFLEYGEYDWMTPSGSGVDSGSGDPLTSCNTPNVYGFKVNNCQKANFSYGSATLGAVYALSARSFVYSGCDVGFGIRVAMPTRERFFIASLPDTGETPYTSMSEALSVCY